MSYINPKFRHPDQPVNELGFTKKQYEGSLSTLCAGCGHDSITAAIIKACFELAIEPHKVAKLSGIGCSSKTPAYFLGHSHGFNSAHGRMPSIATGANVANRDMHYIGISGDGDSASIGMGQFMHVARRNLNMLYIVENNGCYGLTKGQDSATADIGSKAKSGVENPYAPIDLVNLALEMKAPFVARSFSGDKEQLVPLIKAALLQPGFAFIDVVSPCVTFNNNPGSTKAYKYIREHSEITGKPDFIPKSKEITAEYNEGTTADIKLHDGSSLQLHKLAKDFDPTDRLSAIDKVIETQRKGEVLTGLIYVKPESNELHDILETSDKPLRSLTEKELCPGSDELEKINAGMR
jgi:2-oxoglutarate ferredoxin oxidoreductase subunit beta